MSISRSDPLGPARAWLPGFALAALLAFPAGAVARPADADSSTHNGKGTVEINIGGANRDSKGVHVSIDGDSVRNADYVRFGEAIHVEKDEHVRGDVVAIGGPGIVVEGNVDGDCVAIGTSLRLKEGANVAGEVVCIAGNLTLEDSTRVGTDAVSVWGRLRAAPTAVVKGEQTEVSGFDLGLPDKFAVWGGHGFVHDVRRLITRFIWALVLVGIGILVFHLFPTRMRRISETVNERGLVAFLAGLAGWILWLPAFLLLCVTIVGIPVALLLIVFTPIMILLGYLGVAWVAGERVSAKLLGGDGSVAKVMFAGVLILEGTVIVARLFGLVGSFFSFLGLILAVIGHSVVFVAATMGFGAFLMTRFRPALSPPPGMAGVPSSPAMAPPPPPPPPPAPPAYPTGP
jgi:cytoskeletal protein CcmA (bactofilin family)